MQKRELQRKFTRTKEDFECRFCGAMVLGNGYTDHCPSCLLSMHVDTNPGDRKSKCSGTMKAISAVDERGSIRISYICTKCGARKDVKAAQDDSSAAIAALVKKAASAHKKRRKTINK